MSFETRQVRLVLNYPGGTQKEVHLLSDFIGETDWNNFNETEQYMFLNKLSRDLVDTHIEYYGELIG